LTIFFERIFLPDGADVHDMAPSGNLSFLGGKKPTFSGLKRRDGWLKIEVQQRYFA